MVPFLLKPPVVSIRHSTGSHERPFHASNARGGRFGSTPMPSMRESTVSRTMQ